MVDLGGSIFFFRDRGEFSGGVVGGGGVEVGKTGTELEDNCRPGVIVPHALVAA